MEKQEYHTTLTFDTDTDQIQPDSAAILLELLVSSMVFSERVLSQCY